MVDMGIVFHIYGIVNDINGKVYIGQTRQGYQKRFVQHLCPTSTCPRLKKAINKYGRTNFHCELLDIAYSQESADEKEKIWIKALATYRADNGYNLSMGGAIGHFNEETLQKMSASKMGEKNSFYGKKHTAESKEKMSAWKKENYVLGKHPRAKPIECIETGIMYSCSVEASEKTGINKIHIRDVANQKYGRKTAGGFHWRWA